MIAVQLGSSTRTAWLLLTAFLTCSATFGIIWAQLGDWVAAVFCLAGLGGAARVGVLLMRRRRLRASAGMVARARAFVSIGDDALFVSFAHLTVGGRLRKGVLLIGPSTAVFVPLGGWTHLAWEAIQAPFITSFRFVDLAIDVGGDVGLDAALLDAVLRHDGFVVDETWTYSHAQRWLCRPGATGIVWIERQPPASLTARWAATPAPSAERYRSIRNRIAVVASAIVIVLGLIGVVAWRLTGEIDYLVGALFYAVLIGGSVIGGFVLAKQRLGLGDATRHSR